MDVILLERIESLGNMGEVVKVKPGFARNYLLPQKKALRATKENRDYFEERRAELEAANAARRETAMGVSKDVDGVSVVLVRQASESGQLYGSVRPKDIADALSEKGNAIDRTQVRLNDPIKTIGLHKIRIALHPEVVVTVTVNVARSAEEAELQAQGKSLIAEAREEERAAQEETRQALADAAAEAEAEENAEARPE
jgi:large subunit ribosomal protein L9